MTYTISYIWTEDRYGVHIGAGTMYNMADSFATLKEAEEVANYLARVWKNTTGGEARVVKNF